MPQPPDNGDGPVTLLADVMDLVILRSGFQAPVLSPFHLGRFSANPFALLGSATLNLDFDNIIEMVRKCQMPPALMQNPLSNGVCSFPALGAFRASFPSCYNGSAIVGNLLQP